MHPEKNTCFFLKTNRKFRLRFSLFILLFIFSVSLFTFDVSPVYAQQPTQEWVRRFSWQFSNGLSVKIDSMRNVYILMKLYTDSTLNDFGLAKYNSTGTLLWNTYYNNYN